MDVDVLDSEPMQSSATGHSLFWSESAAPTKRALAARLRKMPTTSVRWRSSLRISSWNLLPLMADGPMKGHLD